MNLAVHTPILSSHGLPHLVHVLLKPSFFVLEFLFQSQSLVLEVLGLVSGDSGVKNIFEHIDLIVERLELFVELRVLRFHIGRVYGFPNVFWQFPVFLRPPVNLPFHRSFDPYLRWSVPYEFIALL